MNRLKELRIKYGLSLRKLQEYTGIDFSRLCVIEKTEANLESKTVDKLCNFFRISSTYFFGKDGFIYYYDQFNNNYFSMAYEQYKSLLTDDVVKWVITDEGIKRILSNEGFERIAKADNTAINSLNVHIITSHFIDFLDQLNSFDFNNAKEIILDYFKLKEVTNKDK